MARGNLALDQLQAAIPSGTATRLVTFGGGGTTSGHALVWDSSGNAIDGGTFVSTSAATPILDTSTGNPVFDANGNWIFPG